MNIVVNWFNVDGEECLSLSQCMTYKVNAQSLLLAVKTLQKWGNISPAATLFNHKDLVIAVRGNELGVIAEEDNPIVDQIEQTRDLFYKIAKLGNIY